MSTAATHSTPRVTLISCYEMGQQPLGLSVPAGVLRRAGIPVHLIDTSVEPLDDTKIVTSSFIGISTPMHTALRIGSAVAARVRRINPGAHICFYGMYAGLNAPALAGAADSCLGAEFELPLLELVTRVLEGDAHVAPRGVSPPETPTARRSLPRGADLSPDRTGLAHGRRYVTLLWRGERMQVGTTVTTRGCKHRCRHCPLPAVYDGSFYALPVESVMADVASLVAAGARHITFADPDFLNGPGHAMRVGRALHESYPDVTFDYTAKVSHLKAHADVVASLAGMGNLFVVSAIESLDNTVLRHLDKGHTRDDALAVFSQFRRLGLALRPSLMPFTPWETLDGYIDLLETVDASGLVANVDPVQYTIRLLVPPGSLLLGTPALNPYLGDLNAELFTWTWRHPDPRMDTLQSTVARIAEKDASAGTDIRVTFERIQDAARLARGERHTPATTTDYRGHATEDAPPRLTESWFC